MLLYVALSCWWKKKNSVCSLSLLPFIREYKISFGYVCLTCRSLMCQPTPLVRMSYQAFGKNSPPFYCPKSSARRESFIVPIHLLWSNQAASAPSLFVNLYICETVMMMWLDYLPIWYLFMNRFVNCNVTCYEPVIWVLFLNLYSVYAQNLVLFIYIFLKWPIVISDGQKLYASPISYNGDARKYTAVTFIT